MTCGNQYVSRVCSLFVCLSGLTVSDVWESVCFESLFVVCLSGLTVSDGGNQ